MAAGTPSRPPPPGAASPSTSPRLPSPPPMPELQFGPQSPSISSLNEPQFEEPAKADESARRRVRPGTKAVDMAKGPPLVPLSQLDSPFQLQEHLKALFAHLTHGQSATHSVPITKDTAVSIARPPQINDSEYVDKNLWLYELCRFLTMKANYVSCALMADKPPCSSLTCPEMRASEWQYLCAVHEPPKSCCAIDYVNHTLDWAANVLTSSKHFPSRIQLGGETGNVFQSMRQLTNIFRRVYRIFAHAWFQHREVFWHIESTYGIYMLFKTVCDEYSLVPEDNYTIPPEAEGPREEAEPTSASTDETNIPGSISILRKENFSQNGHDNTPPSHDTTSTVSVGATARRHKHTPSTGSHVATIAEGVEEEDTESQTSAIPHLSSTTSPSSPPKNKNSPERATPSQLGRLDIASTVPAYVPNKPEDPTPTAAQASTPDPLAAAGASPPKSNEQSSLSSPERTKSSSPSKSQSPSKNKSSTSSPPKVVPRTTGNGRRNSGFESEVHSPGGGSIRTAGPDLLDAIMSHVDDDEEGPGEHQKMEPVVDDEDEKHDDDNDDSDNRKGERPSSVDNDKEHEGEEEGADGDEDENETMERIDLPDHTKSPEVGAKSDEDAAKEEQEKEDDKAVEEERRVEAGAA